MDKLLLVHDAPILAKAIAHLLLESQMHVKLDTANSFEEMEEKMKGDRYKAVIMDICLKKAEKMVVLLNLAQRHPSVSFLLFVDNIGLLPIKALFRSGICGALEQTASIEELVSAIRQIMKSEIYINRKLFMEIIVGKKPKPVPVVAHPFEKLTTREIEIAKLMLEGEKNGYIGKILLLKPSTVSTFKTRIFFKLKVRNMMHLKQIFDNVKHSA